MKVYVGCMTKEDPFDYRLIDGDRPRGYVGSEKRACSAMQPEGCSDIRYGDTDLLAAAALLMEVAK